MRTFQPNKARFEIVPSGRRDVLAIVDLDDGDMSVTNDAEAVVAFLADREYIYEDTRLIYRDSCGIWDELRHDGNGRFLGFKVIHARTMAEASSIIRAEDET